MIGSLDDKSLLVLGAGATRAFAPKAPLVEDDYGLQRLLDHFRGLPYALEILENEKHRRNGKINIEQLMTRLHGRMPYDSDEVKAQHTHLLSELMKEFVRKVSLARTKDVNEIELSAFAKLIVMTGVTCITFNYDDILDEAFWKVEGAYRRGEISKQGVKYWHPDGGYGFFVRPSEVTIREMGSYMDRTSMLLLKLHGSVNWFVRSGENKPYSIGSILHDQNWYPPHYDVLRRLIAIL